MNKLLVIHPQDDTTEFLNPIWDFISRKFTDIIVHNVSFDDAEHNVAKKAISDYSGQNILFLGHGSTTHFKGAKNDSYSNETFICKADFSLFKDKTILNFSCKSADFFRYEKSFNYIGFDDIPSDMIEVTGAREFEHNIYPDVDEDVINYFKAVLVQIVTNSVYDWLEGDFDAQKLYNRMKIRINREIINCLKKNKDLKFKKAIIGLLDNLKKDMTYFCTSYY